MRAIATVSAYDMGAASRNALNHSQTLAERKQAIAAAQRHAEFQGGAIALTGGTVHELTGWRASSVSTRRHGKQASPALSNESRG